MDFRKNLTMSTSNKSILIEDVVHKNIKFDSTINGNDISLTINGALFANMNGEQELLDKYLIDIMIKDIFKSIEKNSSKYNKIPNSIIINHRDLIENKAEDSLKNEYLNFINPRYTLDDVYITKHAKINLLNALSIEKNHNKLFNEWGLSNSMKSGRSVVINFYGPPGTGKSMTAEAIGNYLNKKLYTINYSQLESKYVGETPKNISDAFKIASQEDAILVFDEADSLLSKRVSNITQSSDHGINLSRSVMLLELEKFEGIVIFTTNLIDNYDDAFRRRILTNIKFELPNESGREKIWNSHIPDSLPLDETINTRILSKKYTDISGADIKDITLFAAVNAIQRNSEKVDIADFDLAFKYVKSRYNTDNINENLKIKSEIITQEQYNEEVNSI